MRTFHQTLRTVSLSHPCVDDSLTEDALNQWREALGSDEPAKLEKRLRWEGLDLAQAQCCLARLDDQAFGESAASEDPPIGQWLREADPISHGELDNPEEAPAFAELWGRLARRARRTLETRISPEMLAVLTPALTPLQDLEHSLLARLARIGEATLWKQFGALRSPAESFLAHVGVEGDDTGAPRRDKYLAFLEALRMDGLASLFQEFPVLERHLSTVVRLWLANSQELLGRVAVDLPTLGARFDLPACAVLAGIRQELSDPHRGGRAVAILSFKSLESEGREYRLVYKPKDMQLDAAYQEALRHTAIAAGDAPLRSLRVLSLHGYGYMEYVVHRTCADDEALSRFYRNAGRLTAVLHLLACTDCHHENLIADADQLMLIDTETLFEGVVADQVSATSIDPPVQSELQRRLGRSVLRSGLLPQWIFVGQWKTGIDISALGIAPPANHTRNVPGYIGRNSDGMIATMRSEPAVLPTSSPVGIGARNRLADFQEEFLSGFMDQSAQLRRDREAWVGPSGILSGFRGLTRRIVLRATRIYFALQTDMLQPERLRSEWSQGLVLEKLHRATLVSPERPLNWPVGGAEITQMEQLDIPFFEHRIDSKNIRLGESGTLNDFLAATGHEVVHDNFSELSEETIALQAALIRGVIAARWARAADRLEGVAADSSAPKPDGVTPSPSLEARRAEAVRIAEDLLDAAVGSPGADGDLEWLGIELGADNEQWTFGPLGPSLYGGTAGIALFLEILASTGAGDPDRYRAAAHAALRPTLRLFRTGAPWELLRWWRDQPLGISGCGGVLLALNEIAYYDSEVAVVLQQGLPRLLTQLSQERIRDDYSLDLMGGAAGLIGPLLGIRQALPKDLLLTLGKHLVETQDASGGWKTSMQRGRPLTGLSHGAAGIAAALARLARETGHAEFVAAARRALDYERSCFDGTQGNWPDYRAWDESQGAPAPASMSSWCHGAAGIGLARAALLDTDCWDTAAEEDCAIALRHCQTHPARVDHLCCGRMGQAAILQSAGAVLGRDDWELAGGERETEVLADLSASATPQYRCYATSETQPLVPGLFTGYAGIGLKLLPEAQAHLPQTLTAGLLKK